MASEATRCGMQPIIANSGEQTSETDIFSVYPNPTTGNFTIESKLGLQYTIGNVNMQVVSEGKVKANEKKNIELRDCASGFYFIKMVATDGTSKVSKLIKL